MKLTPRVCIQFSWFWVQWFVPLISAPGNRGFETSSVWSQHSEFQTSQGYTMKPLPALLLSKDEISLPSFLLLTFHMYCKTVSFLFAFQI